MGSLLEISAVAAGICSWVAWIAIGLVAGFLADRVFGGRRLLILDITVGLGGAIGHCLRFGRTKFSGIPT